MSYSQWIPQVPGTVTLMRGHELQSMDSPRYPGMATLIRGHELQSMDPPGTWDGDPDEGP